jgi:phosphatidylethanolamine-binding protein (PEBP) family uncharacterized protein
LSHVARGERGPDGRVWWTLVVYDYDASQRAKRLGWKPLIHRVWWGVDEYELYFVGEASPGVEGV